MDQKFNDYVTKIAACNGTGRQELDKLIQTGEITEEEAEMIYIYAKALEVSTALEVLEQKIQYNFTYY